MVETNVDVREDGHVVTIENEMLFPVRGESTFTRGDAEDLRDELIEELGRGE